MLVEEKILNHDPKVIREEVARVRERLKLPETDEWVNITLPKYRGPCMLILSATGKFCSGIPGIKGILVPEASARILEEMDVSFQEHGRYYRIRGMDFEKIESNGA